jgi:hypothetical protein
VFVHFFLLDLASELRLDPARCTSQGNPTRERALYSKRIDTTRIGKVKRFLESFGRVSEAQRLRSLGVRGWRGGRRREPPLRRNAHDGGGAEFSSAAVVAGGVRKTGGPR